MPLTAFSTTLPLLGSYSTSISTEYPGLTFPWVSATQDINSLDNSVISRSFNELEFGVATTWSIGQGKLADESSSLHYQGKTKMYSHSYSGAKEQFGDLEAMSNFIGWQYQVEDYDLVSMYQDILVKTIVWQIYDDELFDSLLITNDSGVVDPQSGNYSSNSLVVITKGIGYRAAASIGFVTKSGYTLQDSSTLLANGLNTEPQIIKGNKLFITRPSVQRATSGQQAATLLCAITVKLYGSYWSQVPELVEVYDQGWVLHSESEPNKLKPPGKAYLNDNFPAQLTGVTGVNPTDV